MGSQRISTHAWKIKHIFIVFHTDKDLEDEKIK